MNDLDPAFIARHDQTMAECNETLDIFAEIYRETVDQYGQENAILGLAETLENKAQNTTALAQHLAVAIRRIVGLEDIIDNFENQVRALADELTGNDSPQSN